MAVVILTVSLLVAFALTGLQYRYWPPVEPGQDD